MPQGADVLDVAEHAGLDDFVGVGVEHAVVPLMADRQELSVSSAPGDHLLALGDVPGHQLFAQDVLAALPCAFDGDRGVQMQRQGDDDRLDLRSRAQHLLVVVVP